MYAVLDRLIMEILYMNEFRILSQLEGSCIGASTSSCKYGAGGVGGAGSAGGRLSDYVIVSLVMLPTQGRVYAVTY